MIMWLNSESTLFSLPAHQLEPQPQRQPQPPPQQQQQPQQRPQPQPQQSQESTVSPPGFFLFSFILHLFYILATTITSNTSTTITYHHQHQRHQHHQHHPHFKQPPSHLTRQNGNGNRSRNSRRNASRVAGKFFWFSLFHYTNVYFSLDYEWITAWDK